MVMLSLNFYMSNTQNTSEEQYKNADWLEQQYVAKDRSQAEIAAECGVSQRTISNWCAKFDIKKPETAQFGRQTDGYEQWKCEAGPGSADTVLVHRLLATLKVDDLSELDGMEIHHKNGRKRDNRLENIEVLSPAEHRQRHASDKPAAV